MINKSLAIQIFTFGCVGIAATVTHYSVALIALDLFGASAYFANFLGYACAVSVSLFGHGRWTFKSGVTWSISAKFILVSLAAFVISEFILAAMVEAFALPPKISIAVVVFVIPAISFILNKLWVFTR